MDLLEIVETLVDIIEGSEYEEINKELEGLVDEIVSDEVKKPVLLFAEGLTFRYIEDIGPTEVRVYALKINGIGEGTVEKEKLKESITIFADTAVKYEKKDWTKERIVEEVTSIMDEISSFTDKPLNYDTYNIAVDVLGRYLKY